MTLYNELKGWQGLLGAFFGLLALVMGALLNSWLARRNERLRRTDEAHAVAAALYAEMIGMRDSLARLARRTSQLESGSTGLGRGPKNPFDIHYVEETSMPEPIVYPAIIDKVGSLPPNATADVVSFYTLYREAARWRSFLGDDPIRTFGYSVGWVLRPAYDAVLISNRVLIALRDFAKIDDTPGGTDLGETAILLELEADH